MTDLHVRHAIGVDLGGTKIGLGIVDSTGKILNYRKIKTHVQEGPKAVEDQILSEIQSLQKESGLLFEGVGIGIAGQIHPQTGEVIFAPNLNWKHIPLKKNLKKALHLPVFAINDVRAITWGEWLYGAGQGCQDILCIFIGTGIGGGVVSGGHFLTGCSHTLGEIGHTTVNFNGPLCTCGNHGCLEAYAGGWGITARAKEMILSEEQQSMKDPLLALVGGNVDHLTSKEIVKAYHQKDPLANRVIVQATQAFIAGCISLIHAFNPCRLILGGGLLDGYPELVELVDQGIKKYGLKAATQPLTVVRAKLGAEAGVIGSAAVVFNSLKESEERT